MRYFHESLPTAPVAQEMLDLLAELYVADAQGLVGTAKLEFRKQRAGPIRRRMGAWLAAQRGRHPPKSPIAAAIRYAENQWEELGVFLDDVRVPLDDNGSDRALRRVSMSIMTERCWPMTTWKWSCSAVRRTTCTLPPFAASHCMAPSRVIDEPTGSRLAPAIHRGVGILRHVRAEGHLVRSNRQETVDDCA